jgi:hypothetical protein
LFFSKEKPIDNFQRWIFVANKLLLALITPRIAISCQHLLRAVQKKSTEVALRKRLAQLAYYTMG